MGSYNFMAVLKDARLDSHVSCKGTSSEAIQADSVGEGAFWKNANWTVFKI
jgi:hypothetical protein